MGFFDQNPTANPAINNLLDTNPVNVIQNDIQVIETTPAITTEIVSWEMPQNSDIGNIDAILSEVNSLMTSSVLPMATQPESAAKPEWVQEISFLSGMDDSKGDVPTQTIQTPQATVNEATIVSSSITTPTLESTVELSQMSAPIQTPPAIQEVASMPIFNMNPTAVEAPAIPKTEEKIETAQATSFFPAQTTEFVSPVNFSSPKTEEETTLNGKSVSAVLEDSKLSPISDELRQIIIHLHNERKSLEGALTKDVKEKESIEQKIADKQVQLSKLRAKIEIVEKAQAFIGNQAEEEKRVIL